VGSAVDDVESGHGHDDVLDAGEVGDVAVKRNACWKCSPFLCGVIMRKVAVMCETNTLQLRAIKQEEERNIR